MFVNAKLRGAEEVMDMRTRRARFSKGENPLGESRRKGVRGFTFYFVYFATLVTASPLFPHVALVASGDATLRGIPS